MNHKKLLQVTTLGLVLCWIGFIYASQAEEAVNKSGNTKTIIKSVYQYTEKFGKYESVFKEQVHLGYDKKGNLVKEVHYNKEGDLINRYQCQYNEQDQLISKVLYQPDGSITEQWVYQYDPVSNTLTTVRYNKKELLSSFTHRLVYKYTGNKTEESEYNADELIRKMVYLNNDQGKPIEVSWYNPDGRLYRQWFYKYDQKGNRIEERCCHGDGTCYQEKRWEILYDNKDRLTKSTEYQPIHKFGESYEEPVIQIVYEYEYY